jgi:threonine dehydrogenase-like Zn-dependent dehydrogenase
MMTTTIRHRAHRRHPPRDPRAYIEELLSDILEGRIEPGRVFDRTVDLDGVPDGYRAMADREALKVMIKP